MATGEQLAATAREGVQATWAESAVDWCLRFIRQVWEQARGIAPDPAAPGAAALAAGFAGSARDTEQNWLASGVARAFAQVGAANLRPGDVLLYANDPSGNGHAEMVVGGGQAAANSRLHGGKGIGDVILEGVTSVARLAGWDNGTPDPYAAYQSQGPGMLDRLGLTQERRDYARNFLEALPQTPGGWVTGAAGYYGERASEAVVSPVTQGAQALWAMVAPLLGDIGAVGLGVILMVLGGLAFFLGGK